MRRFMFVALALGCAQTPRGGEGTPVQAFTLRNRGGLTAKLTNYGATLTEMHVPDKNGVTADVVLGFAKPEAYEKPHPYFGGIMGRCANRIAKARFTLDGKEYVLAANNGPHHLHGGVRGWDRYAWDAEPRETQEGPSVRFTRVSPDGEEGYPGAATATVVYTLTHANELRIEMTVTADKPTVVNLAQHSYWNLAGHASGDVLGHELLVNADRYTPGDAELIPTGKMEPVAGTPFDFTRRKRIGAEHAKTGMDRPGYDHNFVINGRPGELQLAASIVEPISGRGMELHTTAPGMQLYTGNFLDGTVQGKGGAVYLRHAGFCLESQHHPDSIHKPDWPSVVLRPGETYRHVMSHRFSAR